MDNSGHNTGYFKDKLAHKLHLNSNNTYQVKIDWSN